MSERHTIRRVDVIWNPCDLYVGVYIGENYVFVFPFPCVGIRIRKWMPPRIYNG